MRRRTDEAPLRSPFSPAHELLLDAILLDGEKATSAWRSWREAIDWQSIDYPSQRLLPMLYAKLAALGVEHPDMRRYKGVYRHTWSTNQALLHAVVPLLRDLRSAGIGVVLLKGFALTLHYHRDFGLRPMADFDVLVPLAQRDEALRILGQTGWQGDHRAPHAQNFVKDRLECDLHWHLLPECCAPDDDADLWRAIRPFTVGELQVAVLDPADMLLHICVHGSWWNPTAPLRWIVDAMTVLAHDGGLDWQRLIAQTRARGLALPVGRALHLLVDRYAAAIPPHVLATLDDVPATLRQRLEFQARTSAKSDRGPLDALLVCAAEYRQRAQGDDVRPGPLGFLRYLQDRWSITPSELPVQMLREVWQRR
jgi:hypothetical protein